jgi:hypothetical protein
MHRQVGAVGTAGGRHWPCRPGLSREGRRRGVRRAEGSGFRGDRELLGSQPSGSCRGCRLLVWPLGIQRMNPMNLAGPYVEIIEEFARTGVWSQLGGRGLSGGAAG